MHHGRVHRQIGGRGRLGALREVAHVFGNQGFAAARRCRARPAWLARGRRKAQMFLCRACRLGRWHGAKGGAAGKGHIIDYVGLDAAPRG